MRLYELNYLIAPDIKAEEIQEDALEIESLIQNEKGILTQERKKDRIKLAYPVKDKKEGLLFTVRFQIEEEKIKNLEQKIKNMPHVLRVMIERVKKRKAAPRMKRFKKVSATPKPKENKAKVELKKIEEKLDQILDES